MEDKIAKNKSAVKARNMIKIFLFVILLSSSLNMVDASHRDVKLGIANIITNPSVIRPGDDFVEITTFIESSGVEDVKDIEAILSLPKGLEHSYSDNNRKWVGKLLVNESKQISFFVNIDEDAEPKEYDLDLTLNYENLDNKDYDDRISFPLFIKEKPNIEVVYTKGRGLAGSKIDLEVTLENTGTEDAEAVDVRIIKQSSQPFSFDLRSNYIGELKIRETEKAVFTIKIDKDAELKDHNLKLFIRAKGDSDEGDNNIYMFNENVVIGVNGRRVNPIVGLVVSVKEAATASIVLVFTVILLMVLLGLLMIFRRTKRKNKINKEETQFENLNYKKGKK